MTKAIHRYRRFTGWDYARGASLFITIATEPRRPLFGEIKNGKMVYTPLGRRVVEALLAMPRLNPGLPLFGWVVMPDHVHFNCALAPGLKEPLKVLGFAIRRFKNYTNAEAKRLLAERSSAVAASEGRLGQPPPCHSLDVQAIAPVANSLEGQALAPVAPSPDGQTVFGQPGPIWQQGYHDYLLRSREMIDSTERYIAYNEAKWELMYGSGGGLRVIEPLSSPRLDIEPFAENRYLEIARGNDETEFGRSVCLDLNAEIIEIATACEGLAIYWKADGPHVLAKG